MSTNGFGLESGATTSTVLKYVAAVGAMATFATGMVLPTVPNLPEKTTFLNGKFNLSYPNTSLLKVTNDLPKNFGNSQRIPLGKRLMALRQKAIEEGLTLLTKDEILEEVQHRRGEI